MNKIIKRICNLMFIFLLTLSLSSCALFSKKQKVQINEVTFTNVPSVMEVGEEVIVEFAKQEKVTYSWVIGEESVLEVTEVTASKDNLNAFKIKAIGSGESNFSIILKLDGLIENYEFDIKVKEPKQEEVYTISYVNDGSYMGSENPSTYKVSELPIQLVSPTLEGYSFGGWYTKNDFSGDPVTSISEESAGDITLYAKWTVNIYKINYFVDGGEIPCEASQEYTYNVVATLCIPTKGGYNFAGWYTNPEFTGSPVTQVKKGTVGDFNVYAKWTELVYSSISYQLDGGMILSDEVNQYLEGVGTKLPTPTKKGYSFLGWSLSENSNSYITSISASQKGDVTLYAHWELDDEFVIKYVYDEGETPSFTAKNHTEFEKGFWTAFANWYGWTGNITTFKTNVLAKWSTGADGGYKFYMPGEAGVEDPGYFINDPETPDIWREWFKEFEATIKKINSAQSAYASTYVGYKRLNEIASNSTVSYWTAERKEALYALTYVYEELIFEYEAGQEFDLTPLVIDDGREFLGWMDEEGNIINKITKDMVGDLELTAVWSDGILVETFQLNNPSQMDKLTTYQLEWVITPEDASTKNVLFKSSNESVVSVNKYGLMEAHKEGIAVISYTVLGNRELSGSFEVEVIVKPYIDATLETTSIVEVGQKIKINATVEAAIDMVVWKSSNPSIATVDETGFVTGVSEGYVEIIASMASNPDVELVIGVTVLTKEDLELLSVITNAHNGEVYYVPLLNVAYDYDTSVACSASDLLFNFEYYENTQYFIEPNRPKMTSIEFITVHYSGMPKAHQDGEVIAQALYNNWKSDGNGVTSWHYSTGNDGIFYSQDATTVGYHAGDGTGTAFKWINTGVKATSNTKPTFKIVANSSVSTGYSFEVNGQKTNVAAPTNGKLTFFGPTWKIENGYYYMGNTWKSGDYGYIASRGGNLNSIGIESACNYGSDLWYTYQITAQLVSRLLERNNLDITRVQGHHTFSGKDCPQTLLEGEGELWYKFIECVEAEYALYTTFGDYTITSRSSDDSLLQDNGRVVNIPNSTTSASYTLTIKNNKTNVTKTITLSSIIHGLYTYN